MKLFGGYSTFSRCNKLVGEFYFKPKPFKPFCLVGYLRKFLFIGKLIFLSLTLEVTLQWCFSIILHFDRRHVLRILFESPVLRAGNSWLLDWNKFSSRKLVFLRNNDEPLPWREFLHCGS